MRMASALLLLLSLSLHAQDECDFNFFRGAKACLTAIGAISKGLVIGDCAPIKPECADRVSRLTADGTVNITIANGYGDEGGTTKDHVYGKHWHNLKIQHLTSPCPNRVEVLGRSRKNYKGKVANIEAVFKDREETSCGKPVEMTRACGFTRTDDPEILENTYVVNGKTVKVQIRIAIASLTSQDSSNRASRRTFVQNKFCSTVSLKAKESCITKNASPKVPSSRLLDRCEPGDEHLYQLCRSDYVRQIWQNAIKSGEEIVMYNGHARNGGGPSFDPPKVLSNGKVDYDWYRRVKEGHNQEAQAFIKAVGKKKAPVIYASNSCNSHKHFFQNGRFPQVSPSTSYVLSSRTSFADEGVMSTLSTIDGTLNGLCGKELNKKVQGASCAFNLYHR